MQMIYSGDWHLQATVLKGKILFKNVETAIANDQTYGICIDAKQLTESTDEIMDTTHITRAIFQLKTGVPHCNG